MVENDADPPSGNTADDAEEGRAGTARSGLPWVRRAPEEPVFEKTVVPRFEDYLAVDFADGQLVSRRTVIASCGAIGFCAGLMLGYGEFRAAAYASFALIASAALAAGLVAGWGLFFVIRWLLTAFFSSGLREAGLIDRPVLLRFDRTGVEGNVDALTSSAAWNDLIDCEADDQRFFFWITTKQAFVLRKDAFETAGERDAFERWITTWYGREPRRPPRMARERTPPAPVPGIGQDDEIRQDKA